MRDHYTEEDATAILRRAVERQPIGDEMSRAQLEAIASEIGITPEALATAEADWRADQEREALRSQFDTERRAAFWRRVPRFIGGALLALGIVAAVTGPGSLNGLGLMLLLLALLVPSVKLAIRGMETYQRGPATEEAFHWWLHERAQPPIPPVGPTDQYAATERTRPV